MYGLKVELLHNGVARIVTLKGSGAACVLCGTYEGSMLPLYSVGQTADMRQLAATDNGERPYAFAHERCLRSHCPQLNESQRKGRSCVVCARSRGAKVPCNPGEERYYGAPQVVGHIKCLELKPELRQSAESRS